mgnify:FL=1
MQKILSLMSVFSFITSVGVVGTAGYVYVNRDNIRDNIKAQVTKGVQDAIVSKFNGGGLPKTTGGVLPPVPAPKAKLTGPAVPF